MPPETLIDGYSFFVSERPSEVGPDGGLFHQDTRYLSELEVSVGNANLVPIGETLDSPNSRKTTLADAGTAVNEIQEQKVAKHTELVLTREQSVHEGVGYAETITVHNHAAFSRTVTVRVAFETDFADLFEVRGMQSDIERTIETTVGTETVTKRYQYEPTVGETVAERSTVRFETDPDTLEEDTATFTANVPPQGTFEIPLAVEIDTGSLDANTPTERSPPVTLPTVKTGTDAYDAVFDRAASDLSALTTETEYGPVPLAGTPWFATPFGRDAILTAHQTLSVAPALANGTLRYFAAHQGRKTDPDREEEAGKMFHEIRQGQLADQRLIPHTPYYGTIDATPLWVMLLAETCRWYGTELAAQLADSLGDALDWITRTSEATTDDPFLYYRTETSVLNHKAWKDTADSVRFADGTVADGSLAVAEVQGYAAAALRGGADLLEHIDTDVDTASSPESYRDRAEAIEQAFDEEFWLPERSFYGLAKDGEGNIVDAVTSNVGHCLWTGTIPEHRADDVVDTLVNGPLSSGLGLRTMSPADRGYSPVSYHAGGVWPHDTSLIALGLARYGYDEATEELARGVLEAASHFEHCRLPELYCGFGTDSNPVVYPAACTPQAWAAGAPFAFLQAAFHPTPTADGVDTRRSSALFDESAADVFSAE